MGEDNRPDDQESGEERAYWEAWKSCQEVSKVIRGMEFMGFVEFINKLDNGLVGKLPFPNDEDFYEDDEGVNRRDTNYPDGYRDRTAAEEANTKADLILNGGESADY